MLGVNGLSYRYVQMRSRIILATIGVLLVADINAFAADMALVISNWTYSYAARLNVYGMVASPCGHPA
jgi:hypothetical protein